jgi:hypothetical protein
MDKRNSKTQLLNKIDRLFEVGEWGIEYVGQANYREREAEALYKFRKVMYDEDGE